MSITLAGSGEGGGYGGVELTLDGNFLPLLESTLVYCDKMSTIPSLGAKEEIKRQQIKFSDSELDLANIETNGRPYSLWHFPLQFCLTTMAQKQKLCNF